MRLYELSFQAIGPFPGEHHIDFTVLGASGLFLLEGPTGAGKSTIIDAIVYALYGSVAAAGSSSLNERLRSHHASPEVASYIELVFETGYGIYRVRRSPEYQRPKKRGTGTTTEQTQVRLWKLSSPEDSTGEVISTATREADAELLRILTLSREQFEQTVVLPQGQFARFLGTAPDDRRVLLQRLFGTEIYDRIQDELALMRKETLEQIRDDTTRIQGLIETLLALVEPRDELADRLRAASGVGAGDGAGRPGARESAQRIDIAELGGALAELRAETAELSSALDVEQQRLGSVAAVAEARHRGATEAVSRLERLSDLRERRDKLESDRPSHRARLERLENAKPAEAILAQARLRDDAVRQVDEARGRLAHSVDTAREHGVEVGPSPAGPDDDGATRSALAADRDVDLATVGSLAHMVELESQVPKRRERLDALREELTDSAARHEELTVRQDNLPQERAELAVNLERERAQASAAPQAEVALFAAREVLEAARNAAGLREQLARVEVEAAHAASSAKDANDTMHRLYRLNIEGMAGTLAKGLVSGEPCVVCGALDHPNPAPIAEQTPSDEDIAEAEARLAASREFLTEAQSSRALAAVELERSVADSMGIGIDDAKAGVAAAVELLAVAKTAEHAAELYAQALDKHAETSLELHRLGAEAARAVTERKAVYGLDAGDLSAMTASIQTARGQDVSVAARCARIERRAKVAAEVLAGFDAVRELAAKALREEEGLAISMADGPFENREAAEAAVLGEAERDVISQACSRWSAEDAVVESELAAPNWAEPEAAQARELVLCSEEATLAARKTELELEMVEAARVAAQRFDESELARQAFQSQLARSARCLDYLAMVEPKLADMARAGADSADVIRMADLATGADGDADKRITLGTFVLMRRFGDVVAAANDRLTSISDGRYELERIDEVEKGQRARRAGLGLHVIDHATGKTRDPKTLSGGETFYVSLCLALGLADTVVAEAGGVDLGTLFVDEGFGSLDSDTLDSVLGELGKLRAGGRLVGIVSHVEDLKQRIGERVEVRRLPRGTSTIVVRA